MWCLAHEGRPRRQETDPFLLPPCLRHMEAVNVQSATHPTQPLVFHPLVLHNKSESRFNLGSMVVDIYDAVKGEQSFKKKIREISYTRPTLITSRLWGLFVFVLKIGSTHWGFGGKKKILLLNNKRALMTTLLLTRLNKF